MSDKWLWLGIGAIIGGLVCHYVTIRGTAVVSTTQN
jgi:hypothetical protein